MRKSYKFKKKIRQEKKFAYNYKIRAEQVVVIDENGDPLGEMETKAAIKLAEERGLDLVEVAPLAKPPVTKIMDYGSFKYQQEKQLKKQKSQSKSLETKNIRLSFKISDHDQQTKLNQINKFLDKGHKIKIEMLLRGRELRHKDLAQETLKEFCSQISTPNSIEQPISKQGNKLFLILMPTKS